MAINPDTGEYTGNDLERLEEALDKFLCLGPVYAKDWESSDRAKLRHLEAANRDIYAAEMYQYQAVLKRLENNPPYNP